MVKRTVALILVLILAAGFAGCKDETPRPSAEKSDTNDSVISIFSFKPDTLCPIASSNEANIRMLGIVYEGLIELSDNYTALPCLAESWTAANESAEWTLNLKKNISWHTGETFTAKDVVYTVNQIKKLENSPYAYNVSKIAQIEAVGDYTVKITLSASSANFINLLYFPIIKNGDDEIDTINYQASGTGPYVLEERNDGNIYYLTANDKWWGGRVVSDTIQVKMLPSEDTALYAFGSGSIDLVLAENMDWGKFVDYSETEYTSVATPIYTFVGINHKSPQLAMPELRKAISLALDREELIEEVRQGYGVAASSPVRPEWFVCQELKLDLKQNIEKAKSHLEENGWKLSGSTYHKVSDGVEYKASFNLLVNEENTMRQNAAGLILKQLESAGIKVNIVKASYEEYTKRIAEGNYDAFIGSMSLGPDLDFSAFVAENNIFGFSNDVMLSLSEVMQKKQKQTDIKNSYMAFANRFEYENPVIGLYFENSVMIYSKQLKSDVKPSYFDVYSGIENLQKGAGE